VGTEGRSSIDTLRVQIKSGFDRRSSSFVEAVFTSHCIPDETKYLNPKGSTGIVEKCPSIIPKANICAALIDLGINMDDQGASILFQEFDTDKSNGLSLEEFQQLVRKPPRIVEWARTLGLPEVLADAMPCKHGADALRMVSELTDDEIENVIGALLNGLRTILRKSANELKEAFVASDMRMKNNMSETKNGSKFDLIPLSCGTIDDFHIGLERRIGKFAPSIFPHL
jgi:hypothetical protein